MSEPRTEMACRICGCFSSAQTCWPCSRNPAYFKLVALQAEVRAVRKEMKELREVWAQIGLKGTSKTERTIQDWDDRLSRASGEKA